MGELPLDKINERPVKGKSAKEDQASSSFVKLVSVRGGEGGCTGWGLSFSAIRKNGRILRTFFRSFFQACSARRRWIGRFRESWGSNYQRNLSLKGKAIFWSSFLILRYLTIRRSSKSTIQWIEYIQGLGGRRSWVGTESHPRPCVKRERSKVEWICYMNMELRILF